MNQQYLLNPEAPVVTRNRNYIKEFLSKPFLLIAFIVIIASTILSYIVAAVSTSAMIPFVEVINEYANNMTDGNVTFSVSGNISLGNIVSILLIVSLIAMYVASRNQDKPDAPKGAVTTFHIWSILSMIGDFITAGVFLLCPLLFGLIFTLIAKADTSALGVAPLDLPGRVIFVTIAICSIIFIAYAVLYIIKGISGFRFGSSLKNSISTPELSAKGCKAFAVTNIINSVFVAFCSIVSSFVTLVLPSIESPSPEFDFMFDAYKAIPMDVITVCSLINTLLSLVTPVCLAIFALRCKKHIENAGENGCNLPAPAPFVPVQTPQPAYTTSTPQPQQTTPAQPAADTDNDNPYAEAFGTPEPVAPTAEQAPAQENTSPAPKFCNMCGLPVKPEQNFCNGCGHKLK